MISWALAACAFVGSWFTFKKMGLPGWKGIIPFYNYYVLFDTVWEKKKFWRYITLLIITVGLCILYAIVLGVLAVAAYLVADAGSRRHKSDHNIKHYILSGSFPREMRGNIGNKFCHYLPSFSASAFFFV